MLLDQTADLIAAARLRLDGVDYDLGFDLFKPIYNITNIIADICRDVPELASIEIVTELDETVTSANNIPKFDLICTAGSVPILTIRGFVLPSKVERSAT